MKLGVHLPQAGIHASPDLIVRHAMRAEALGLDDVWVSEHVIVPQDIGYPVSPILFDPIVSLTYAAAVTKRVRLGTSVLVLPIRHPLPLAKELGTLQTMSGGRLILGAGVGWLESEFAALGVPFKERGKRMDEGLAMMRAVWSQDPVSFTGNVIDSTFVDMCMRPLPSAPIPVWIGGTAPRQIARAIASEGWHGSRIDLAALPGVIAQLRRARPEPAFTISMRLRWDAEDVGELKARLHELEAMGVQHAVLDPVDRDAIDWDKFLEGIGRIAGG